MASIYRRGKSWYLHWTENGEQKKLSLGNVPKAAAVTAKNQKEALLHDRKRPIFISGRRFVHFADDYLAWYENEYPASASHVEMVIQTYLQPFFEHDYLGTITLQKAEEFKHKRLRTVSAGTIKRELQILQAILNKAVEWNEIRNNPLKGLKPPKNLNSKPIRWYSKHELSLIYQDSLHSPTWRLLANTGLRRAELLKLKWSNVEGITLRVVSSDGSRTKSGKWRIVPLSKSALLALESFQNITADAEYVLPRMQPHSLTTAFNRVLKKAGLDGNLHCLRHTFAAHLLMRGVPLYTVSRLLGHASIETTQIYAHLSDEHLQNAVEGLDL